MDKLEVNKVSIKDELYPKLLAGIPNPPEPLYFLGDFKPAIFEKTLAVVGSRSMTMYGEWVVKTIVAKVAQAGITVVSGFMYGVDATAHKVTLDAGGTTIAVMAGGVDYIFPANQEDLYWEIAEKGMVVSEFHKPDFGGKWMFATRNRIVAGLSQAVLVVEAAEKSGSLITADYAKQYKRQIFAVPGNLNSPNSVGTLKLLKSGAKLVTCAEDILSEYFVNSDNYRASSGRAVNKRLKLGIDDALTNKVVNLLNRGALSVDQLAIKVQSEPAKILQVITTLALAGHLTEKGGKYYVV